jgi:hypothetical protein
MLEWQLRAVALDLLVEGERGRGRGTTGACRPCRTQTAEQLIMLRTGAAQQPSPCAAVPVLLRTVRLATQCAGLALLLAHGKRPAVARGPTRQRTLTAGPYRFSQLAHALRRSLKPRGGIFRWVAGHRHNQPLEVDRRSLPQAWPPTRDRQAPRAPHPRAGLRAGWPRGPGLAAASDRGALAHLGPAPLVGGLGRGSTGAPSPGSGADPQRPQPRAGPASLRPAPGADRSVDRVPRG